MNDLKDSYTLADLLLEAGRRFKAKTLRKFTIIFYEGLSYTVESTDGKTGRLRYSHLKTGDLKVLAYVDVSKQDVLMREVDKDIRAAARAMPLTSVSATLQIFLPEVTDPVLYNARPGGLAYTKAV